MISTHFCRSLHVSAVRLLRDLLRARKKIHISVIIPAFNSSAYISDCIESVVSQDLGEKEIIVVDDGSTDDTYELASVFPNVVVKRQQRKGACAARNCGFSCSSGAYVKFLDSDDFLFDEALKKQLEFARGHDLMTVTYGSVREFTDEFQECFPDRGRQVDSSQGVAGIIKKNIYTSCPLYRREVIERVGGFDERLKANQETNLNVRIALIGGRFVFDGVNVYARRIHSGETRLSNRKRDPDKEFEMYLACYNPVAECGSLEDRHVLAAKTWERGRRVAYRSLSTAQRYAGFARELVCDNRWCHESSSFRQLFATYTTPFWLDRAVMSAKKCLKRLLNSPFSKGHRND